PSSGLPASWLDQVRRFSPLLDDKPCRAISPFPPRGQLDVDVIPLPGAGLVQRCVVVQKDQLGFGFTVCGERVKLVQNVRAGGAAVKAGVREGDRIIKVNGSLVSSMSHQEVVKLIKCHKTVFSPIDVRCLRRDTAPAPPSPSGPSGSPSQRITGPKPLRDSEVQKHASQILRKMLQQEEMELQALMEERGRNPSPSLEERIESAKRRAHQVRLKLLPDAVRPPAPPRATAVDVVPLFSRQMFRPLVPPGGDAVGNGSARIIGPEDEDAYAFDEMDGPFRDVELLKSRPAHMTIFLRYVFTQLLDPNPLLFYLSAEAYLSAAPKDARSLAPQIYSHFLHPDAVRTAAISPTVAARAVSSLKALRNTCREDIRRPLSELQRRVLPHVQDQLVDYRYVRHFCFPPPNKKGFSSSAFAAGASTKRTEGKRASPPPARAAASASCPTRSPQPSGAKKDKEAEDRKRNPILKYIGKPRSASQSSRRTSPPTS
uniref:PDZ domain-containing protein n=1 Tax=Hippocampus comes TaxID=109280 RepID=A0A3Q3DEP5_HIPCM